MPRTNSTRDEIVAFETKVATTFASFATADAVSDAGLKTNLSRAGITAKVTATCDNLTIEVQVPEHPGIKASEDAAELKEGALDTRAAAYLKARKAAVWSAIKSMAGQSTGIKAEQAIEALRTLGYDASDLPSTKATVTAELARGRNEGYDSVEFVLDGEGHTVESVTEALVAAGAKLNPAEALVMAAFSGAELGKSRQPVRNVRVNSNLTWPSKSRFHA
jgi:hypothetical protein